MAYIGNKPTVGNFQICDAISVVNGQAAYTMQVGSVNVIPQSANHMIVSLNGTIQKPNSSYTVSGSTITFSSNLSTGDVIDFIQILGDVLDLGVPSDATVTSAKLASTSVTAAKLNNDIISGTTALTSEPADTDEFLVSDAGTLKRIDYSLIKGSGAVELVYSGNLSTAVFNIDNVFSTSHRVYKIFVDGAYPSNDGEMQFNFRSGGASGAIQNAAAYRFTGVRQERNSAGNAAVQMANDSWGLTYVRLGQSLESANAEYNMNLELTVYNPIDTKPTYFVSISNQMDSSGTWVVGYHNNGIYWNNTSITGIALNTASGSWSGGKVRVYGYKES